MKSADSLPPPPHPTGHILFDQWTSQIEVQSVTDPPRPRLDTLYGMIRGNNWTYGMTTDPITTAQLTAVPKTVLVILTRFNYAGSPTNPAFTTTPDGGELSAIYDWVTGGGSLLHMTNHGQQTPTRGTNWCQYDAALAAKFGITLTNAFLGISNATISGPSSSTSPGINYANPVFANAPAQNVQSICAHDGCLMTIDASNPNNPQPLVTFIPDPSVGWIPPSGSPLPTTPQLFALTMTPGKGKVVYVVNSGWVGDYGTISPAWGLMPYGNNPAFILSVLGWLMGSTPSMEPVRYKPHQ